MDSCMKATFEEKKKSKMRDDIAHGTIEPSTGKQQLNPTQEWSEDKLE